MKRILTDRNVLLMLASTLASVLGMAACGGSMTATVTVTTTSAAAPPTTATSSSPLTSGSTTPSPPAPPSPPKPKPKPRPQSPSGITKITIGQDSTTGLAAGTVFYVTRVGHAVLLTGSAGEKVRVTVTGVIDPSTGTDQCLQARSVGIAVTMTNVGSLLYSGIVGNTNTSLLDSKGATADSPLDLPHSSASWNSTLSPGQSENDLVQFCVSVLAQPAQMQIGLDENATDMGVWLIGGQKAAMGLSG